MKTSILSILVFVSIVGLCIARPQEEGEKSEKTAPSEFGYSVDDPESKNKFGHNEKTDDDGITRGEYYVDLADGRRMTVKYTVDLEGPGSGFKSDVTFSDV